MTQAGWVGRRLPRLEDERLLRGKGLYTDDRAMPGALWAIFVRSPHPHAAITHIDIEAAAAMPGVHAVLTAADYRADGLGPIAHVPNPADAHDVTLPCFGQESAPDGKPDGTLVHDTLMWPLAEDRARFLGEPVAMVVADTKAQARDAAEQVMVTYEPLPALPDAAAALAPGAVRIWPDIPDNLALREDFGDRAAVAAALAGAAHVVRQRFVHQRIANAQMEPRAVIATHRDDHTTLYASTQGVVRQQMVLAKTLGVPPTQVRVVSGDVGGGFGPRSFLEAEAVLACWAARRIGRPVRWRAERSEGFLTDYQARDMAIDATIGFDAEGRILALESVLTGNIGAHSVAYVPLANALRLISTVYHVPVASVAVRGVLTNTASTVAFRGAGRPEVTHAIERLMDLGAATLGLDRIAIRRRNLVARSAMPYRNAMGLVYDSGDFAANLDTALALADWDGFPARRAESAARGLRRGISVANYVESPVGAPRERVELTILADGAVALVAGTQSTGQGHATSFAQVLADALHITPQDVRLITGDTDQVHAGGGTHSDRSMRLVGHLLLQAVDDLRITARQRAAAILGIAADQVVEHEGLFSAPGGNRRLTWADLARAVPETPLSAAADFTGRIPAFPAGCAVCEVELDPQTGATRIVAYSSADDAGQAINPMIVEGQTHGGIVQGCGQALCEAMVTDAQGQVLTGSFMDYAMPRADQFPPLRLVMTEDPTTSTRLRVKGGGEGGIVPALAAVVGAMTHALEAEGVRQIEMPATPQRVWRAIRAAGGQ